jgi:hypothetical protein
VAIFTKLPGPDGARPKDTSSDVGSSWWPTSRRVRE